MAWGGPQRPANHFRWLRRRNRQQPTFSIRDTLHTFTVEQYLRLDIPERTELLGGLIYDVSPRNEPHRYAVRRLGKLLSRSLDSDFIVQIQDTVAIPDRTGNGAPDPDVAVLQDKSFGLVPTAEDALALIEVSDTTYDGKRGDRNVKIPLYVRAGVPAWIVNVPLKQVDSFAILGVRIAVAELFERLP